MHKPDRAGNTRWDHWIQDNRLSQVVERAGNLTGHTQSGAAIIVSIVQINIQRHAFSELDRLAEGNGLGEIGQRVTGVRLLVVKRTSNVIVLGNCGFQRNGFIQIFDRISGLILRGQIKARPK